MARVYETGGLRLRFPNVSRGCEGVIVNTGGGKTMSCTLCHGFDLKGIGDTPPIIGRSPSYVYRQLNDVKRGARNGPTAARMKAIVEKLDEGDMIAIASYLGVNDRFEQAIADFALLYADQAERDYEAVLKAIKAGKIPVESGV